MTIQPGGNLYTQGFGSRPENVEVPHIDTRDPSNSDVNFPTGKPWINSSNNKAFLLTSLSSTGGSVIANWQQSAPNSGGGSGTVNFLQGDNGGQIGPDGVGTINLLSSDQEFIRTVGDLLTNTVTITTENAFSRQTATVGSVIDNSMFFDLGTTPGVYTFDINISGFDITTPSAIGCSIFSTVRTDGINGFLIETPDEIVNKDSTFALSICTVIVSGNFGIFQVEGLGGKTIHWKANVYYTFVS